MNRKLQLLKQLNKEYPGSDKGDHSYWSSYAEFLPDNVRHLLEIGVAKGDSALIWFKYFGKNCDISLIDLFDNPDFVSTRWCRERFFIPYQGNQSDIQFLSTIKTQFDFICDDGSHNAQDQIISFKHLFVNNLKSKGVMAIEDLHCNKEPFYWGGEVREFSDTILWMLSSYKDSGVISNVYFNIGEALVFQNLISRVEIVNEKIAFIWKK